MDKDLEKALVEIEEEYNFPKLKNKDDLEKIFTDLDISNENKQHYLEFLDTNPDSENIEDLIACFDQWLILNSGFPEEIAEAGKVHEFESIIDPETVSKIFTDTEIPKGIQEKYIEFITNNNPGKNIEELRTNYLSFINNKNKEPVKFTNSFEFNINEKKDKYTDKSNDIRFKPQRLTRFEKARVIGARALQISYGAPVLVDYPDNMLDPIDIALLEYDADLIPISVVRK